MNKMTVLASTLMMCAMNSNSFADDAKDQPAQDKNTPSEDMTASTSDTPAPDIQFFPVNTTTAWGTYRFGEIYEVFRCNSDTEECVWMDWPMTSTLEEGGDDTPESEDGSDDSQ